jgi:hypothetical protein
MYLWKIREFYMAEQKKGKSHKAIMSEVSRSIWS